MLLLTSYFTNAEQEATCNPGNDWVTPSTWKQCVETKYCIVPPEAPPGGSVKGRGASQISELIPMLKGNTLGISLIYTAIG